MKVQERTGNGPTMWNKGAERRLGSGEMGEIGREWRSALTESLRD